MGKTLWARRLSLPALAITAMLLAALAITVLGTAASAKGHRTVRARATGAVEPCPKSNPCSIHIHFETSFGEYCNSFAANYGDCIGNGEGNAAWAASRGQAYIDWNRIGSTVPVPVGTDYRAKADGRFKADLLGNVRTADSPNFTVWSACSRDDPSHVSWFTPDRPGKKAGEEGGPLYWNFQNGTLGAIVDIHGFLFNDGFPCYGREG